MIPEILKTLKTHKFISLVELKTPVYGGKYAIINGDKIKTGLCLDAACDLFKTLKSLS